MDFSTRWIFQYSNYTPQSHRWSFLCHLLLLTVFVGADNSSTESNQLRLVHNLFQNYDKTLRSVHNTSTTTNVRLNPALISITETDEASESILFSLWFRMIWMDEFLTWNPSDYGGMEELMVPISHIWYPDVMAENIIKIRTIVPDERNYAIINHNGTVTISIDQMLLMTCDFTVTNFPFDVQNCTLAVSSWQHTAVLIDMFPTFPTDIASYQENSEWDLVSFDAYRTALVTGLSTSAFANVNYNIVIQRKPKFYLTTFVLPSFIITTLSIVGVFSPFNNSGDREEKVTMGLTTLLTMAVILLIITDQMPKCSERMPLLGIFMITQICISAGASITAVFVMHIHAKWTDGDTVPGWILAITFLSKQASSAVQNRKASVISETKKITEQSKLLSLLEELTNYMHQKSLDDHNRWLWGKVAGRLDIGLMIIFHTINAISTVVFLAFMVNKAGVVVVLPNSIAFTVKGGGFAPVQRKREIDRLTPHSITTLFQSIV